MQSDTVQSRWCLPLHRSTQTTRTDPRAVARTAHTPCAGAGGTLHRIGVCERHRKQFSDPNECNNSANAWIFLVEKF